MSYLEFELGERYGDGGPVFEEQIRRAESLYPGLQIYVRRLGVLPLDMRLEVASRTSPAADGALVGTLNYPQVLTGFWTTPASISPVLLRLSLDILDLELFAATRFVRVGELCQDEENWQNNAVIGGRLALPRLSLAALSVPLDAADRLSYDAWWNSGTSVSEPGASLGTNLTLASTMNVLSGSGFSRTEEADASVESLLDLHLSQDRVRYGSLDTVSGTQLANTSQCGDVASIRAAVERLNPFGTNFLFNCDWELVCCIFKGPLDNAWTTLVREP